MPVGGLELQLAVADVEPCVKLKIPVIWVNRTGEELDPGARKPTAEVKNLLEAARLLGAA